MHRLFTFYCALLISSIHTAVLADATQPHVVLCTFYTKSHEQLATEWLLPSIQDTDLEIIIGYGEQYCSSATYLHTGWTKTTKNKVEFIIETIQNNMGNIVIFADADIVLFRPIKDEIVHFLKTKEFVVQIDTPDKKLCSGFFALIANEKTLNLWQAIREYMQESGVSDQGALNHFLSIHKNQFDIEWDFLPSTYFGGGTFKKRLWKPGKHTHIPQNPAMFHANWTAYNNKVTLLSHVKTVVEKREALPGALF